MDKIRIGDIVKFSYNTTPRIYLIVNNRSSIGITTQCVVEDIDDDTAVIHAQSDEEARLVIPTKYLIKVEAEAKKPTNLSPIGLAAFKNTVNSYGELSDDEKPQAIMIDKWEQYTADLAKEIAVKIAGNTNFRDAQEKAAYVVKYVREIVKNLNTTLSVKQVTNQY